MGNRVRKFDGYNEKTGYAKNLKMNDETYKYRRLVMDVIYEAKAKLKEMGVDLPRIEVRIAERDRKALGWAYLGEKIIYIPLQMFTVPRLKPYLRGVVLHEIVHATRGFKHDDNCPLMCEGIHPQPLSEKVMWDSFLKYYKHWTE